MKPIRRILAAVDLEPASEVVLAEAVGLAQRLDATVDVLHVWELPAVVPPDVVLQMSGGAPLTLRDHVVARARRDLDALVAAKPHDGVPLASHLVASTSAARGIVDASREYDLVIVGTHGHGPLRRALLGSTAEKVVRLARCPVLTVRAPRPAMTAIFDDSDELL